MLGPTLLNPRPRCLLPELGRPHSSADIGHLWEPPDRSDPPTYGHVWSPYNAPILPGKVRLLALNRMLAGRVRFDSL